MCLGLSYVLVAGVGLSSVDVALCSWVVVL